MKLNQIEIKYLVLVQRVDGKVIADLKFQCILDSKNSYLGYFKKHIQKKKKISPSMKSKTSSLIMYLKIKKNLIKN